MAGSGAASYAAQPSAIIGVKRQTIAPIDTAVAGVCNGDGNRENVGDIDDNGGDHNSYHIEEVKHSNSDHR